jgi:hypothetical protein
MTSPTTQSTDLGNGWIQQGPRFVWAGEPREGDMLERGRDLLGLSFFGDTPPVVKILRLETANLLADDDPMDIEAVNDTLGCGLRNDGHTVDLPIAALPELAYILARILNAHGLWTSVLERFNSEQRAYLDRLVASVGGNLDATLGEAKAALKAHTS